MICEESILITWALCFSLISNRIYIWISFHNYYVEINEVMSIIMWYMRERNLVLISFPSNQNFLLIFSSITNALLLKIGQSLILFLILRNPKFSKILHLNDFHSTFDHSNDFKVLKCFSQIWHQISFFNLWTCNIAISLPKGNCKSLWRIFI